MNEVKIIEKPDTISFEAIWDILHRAHSTNLEKGIIMHTTELSADELERYIQPEGKCFIAIKDDEIIGTASYRIRKRIDWYVQGKFLDEVLVGVVPEHTGEHIYSLLYNAIETSARELEIPLIVFNTAENNKRKQIICKKKGFQYVGFFVAEDNDHYSVIMAKWLDGCPFSKTKIWFRYHKRKNYIRFRYKPGKIERPLFSFIKKAYIRIR